MYSIAYTSSVIGDRLRICTEDKYELIYSLSETEIRTEFEWPFEGLNEGHEYLMEYNGCR